MSCMSATSTSSAEVWATAVSPPGAVLHGPTQETPKSGSAVATWPEVFQRLGLALPHKDQLKHRLLKAVENSQAKGYHGRHHGR